MDAHMPETASDLGGQQDSKAAPKASQPPWYRDGLRFRCTECGDCCTGEPGYVWVNQAEIEALAKRVGLDVEEFEDRYTVSVGAQRSLRELENGDCVFLHPHSRKCTAYEDRPRQCRTWPFWASNVQSPEAWADTCKVCPGSGQGELVPLQEIERRLAVIRI